ncbi:MAG: sodium:proton exchanger [Deltaproteobacteria bacterium RIFCSPLOWO2_02_FULL_44_10]|nr:MAG: sodium:proton exchanger [Deltaproteobacteria bacterium RIFCSPHIGHO2_02_FULL_44_16]OGQ46372.1 MAG: sodium:proton exchanger [Deltaproteobacteria bacterium RIFCSPLOWO2_02_FULL_44_10]
MTASEMGFIVITLSVLMVSVHSLGYLFERFRQPRLVGEILAGILLGPFVLGKLSPFLSEFFFGNMNATGEKMNTILGFFYWLGLLLLMFISGSQARRVLARENRRETAWILALGTSLPFFITLIIGFFALIPLEPLIGTAHQRIAMLLVLSIAVAVTSIPVISRIFYDLKILHTRFASLILGAAVLEDIILWGVLAIATALVASSHLAEQQMIRNMTMHIGATIFYMIIALFMAPHFLRWLHRQRWNLLLKSSSVGYITFILLAYAALAALMEVNLIFSAFLAGFGVVGGMKGSERVRFSDALASIEKVSFGIFIPIYFLLVGYKLVFGNVFSFWMFIFFLLGSSLLALFSRGIAARMAGFQKLDIFNLAIAMNARGGPGIVLATVACESGIISAAFYTTLVLTAIITSQAAQLWLRFVLQKGWPLLSTNSEE